MKRSVVPRHFAGLFVACLVVLAALGAAGPGLAADPDLPAGKAPGPDAPIGPQERWSKAPARKLTAPIILDDPHLDSLPAPQMPAPPPQAPGSGDSSSGAAPAKAEGKKGGQDAPSDSPGDKSAKGKSDKSKDKAKGKDKGKGDKPSPAGTAAPPPPPHPAERTVLDYYVRVWTLDPAFPELFARGPREHEEQAFGKLVALQTQRKTAERFRKAYVDTSGLNVRVVEQGEARITARVTGDLTVIIAGRTEEMEEADDFVLILEEGKWKILERTEVK